MARLPGRVTSVLTVLLAGLVAVPPAPAYAAVPTTTSLAVQGTVGPVTVEHGQPLTAGATVTAAGVAPDGWVYFVVDGVSFRSDVVPGGTAATTFGGLGAGTHEVSATFVPRDPAQQDGSTSPPTVVTVARAGTKPQVRVSGTRPNRVARLRARVRATYGTTPTGRVSITLRKRGSAGQRTRRVVLEDGTARLELGRLATGRYRVVVRYLGDADHLASRQGATFRVRRR